MREIILIFIACVTGVISLCYCSYKWGEKSAQKEIINRTLQTDGKDCYTTADIEILIFGETQP